MKTTQSISTAIIITCLFCGAVLPTAAQTEKNPRSKHTGGFGHFNGSYETVNLGELNTLLEQTGYPALSPAYLSFGGSGYFVIKNVLFGGGGASLSGQNFESDTTVLNMSGGYGYFSLGYLISSGKRSFFYPNVGLGLGGFGFQLGKKGATTDFREQLETPGGRFHSDAGGYFINLQMAWQRMFGTGSKKGWSLGFKAGYKISPSTWNLNVNGEKSSNAPGINMNGIYASISIGGGTLFGDRD